MAALVFAFPLRKKSRFPLRLLLFGIGWIGLLILSAVFRTHFTGVLPRLAVNILNLTLPLLMLEVCLAEDKLTVLNTWCAGVAAEEIASVTHELLQAALGLDSASVLTLFPSLPIDLQVLVFIAYHFLIDLLLYVLIGRRRVESGDRKSLIQLTILVVLSIVCISVLSTITYSYRTESLGLFITSRLYSFAFALLILLIRFGIISIGHARNEISMMEQVMQQERKQYEQNRENINLINMRCHDLKHQLANLAGRLTDEEVLSLQEAMSIYDNTIKTGNEVLDVVLYENQLSCRKENIQLSCLANGKSLSFMHTRHIYALFSNALRNAMEAVRQLDNPEQRIISIHVDDLEDQVEISVINYYQGEILSTDGGLETTKHDMNHHGFGTMSMRYITEQYGGHMGVDARNGIFRLYITLPKPKENAA